MSTRTRQTTRQGGRFQSAESSAGVSFSDGNMLVRGVAQVPHEVRQWLSSNGLTTYTTVMWQDPVSGDMRCSCNCPGWTRHVPRGCKHVDDMMGLGTCDADSVSSTPVRVRTPEQAEILIPRFEGRMLRGISFD